MSLVPDDKVGKIQFYESHLDKWAENAVAIGTTSEQVAALADMTADARDAYMAQHVAQQAAQAATLRLHTALEKMTTAGAQIILQARSKAGVDGDSIYSLASLPAPAKPSPINKLGTPNRFGVELYQDGSLKLTWKCKHPDGAVGTVYEVSRRIGDGPFVYLTTVGKKKFIDSTVPRGTASMVYQVRAVRSTAVGDAATYVVNLGGGASLPSFIPIRAAA